MRNYKPTGRKRGAPAHNQNNLKHGIYSEYITSADQAGIEVMPADQNADELALARVRIRTCIRKQAEVPPALWVELERVIACYLRIIIALTHKNAVLRLEKGEDPDSLLRCAFDRRAGTFTIIGIPGEKSVHCLPPPPWGRIEAELSLAMTPTRYGHQLPFHPIKPHIWRSGKIESRKNSFINSNLESVHHGG